METVSKPNQKKNPVQPGSFVEVSTKAMKNVWKYLKKNTKKTQ